MSDVTLRAARPADLPVLASLLGELDSGPPLSIERVTAMLGDMARFPGYRLTEAPLRGGRARFRGFLSAGFATA